MKTSKKTKIALAVLIAASACFAEPGWKNAMKGIEGRIKGNKQSTGKTASSSSASSKKSVDPFAGINGSLTKQNYDLKNYKSKKPAKISKEDSVQKKYKLLEKAEAALLKKDFKTCQKYCDDNNAISFTMNTPEADALAISQWAGDIACYLGYYTAPSEEEKNMWR